LEFEEIEMREMGLLRVIFTQASCDFAAGHSLAQQSKTPGEGYYNSLKAAAIGS
jgi:hypothetical protein